MRRPGKWDGWVPTHSGCGLYVFNPKPGSIRLEDIIWGLGHTYRYGGQIHLTVAEHCITVSSIIELLWPDSGAQMGGLLHDMSEAYTHDVQATLRARLQVNLPNGGFMTWKEFDTKLNRQCIKALKLPENMLDPIEIRAADILACALEKDQCAETLGNEDWGLPPIPDEIKGLRLLHLSPLDAIVAFRDRAAELGVPGAVASSVQSD